MSNLIRCDLCGRVVDSKTLNYTGVRTIKEIIYDRVPISRIIRIPVFKNFEGIENESAIDVCVHCLVRYEERSEGVQKKIIFLSPDSPDFEEITGFKRVERKEEENGNN